MKRSHTCLVAILLTALCAPPALASGVGEELANLKSVRGPMALEFAGPMAACVARFDTENPVFHGCMDWHTAVQGVWALAAYTWATGDGRYRPLIDSTLRPELLARDRKYLAENPEFEMPHGRSWFLRLAIDYRRAFPDDRRLDAEADDVAKSLVAHYKSTAPDPLTNGYHNATWALINLYDYGEAFGKKDVVDFVREKVRAYYMTSRPCDPGPEVSSGEFIGICSNWAGLVAKILPAKEFAAWIEKFMPSGLPYAPVAKAKSTHQALLDFSRAWGLWPVYRKSGDARFLKAYLEHLDAGYSHAEFWKGRYETVGHAGPPFGMLAVMASYYDWPPREETAALSKPDLATPLIVLNPGRAAPADETEGVDYYSGLRGPDKPSCPGITLQIARNENRLSGTAFAGDSKAVSRLSGTVDRSGAFEIAMEPTVKGAPRGTIRGSQESNKGLITFEITGSGCTDGKLSFQTGVAQ